MVEYAADGQDSRDALLLESRRFLGRPAIEQMALLYGQRQEGLA